MDAFTCGRWRWLHQIQRFVHRRRHLNPLLRAAIAEAGRTKTPQLQRLRTAHAEAKAGRAYWSCPCAVYDQSRFVFRQLVEDDEDPFGYDDPGSPPAGG